MKTPVVLIIFRRPQTTAKVLDALRQVKPRTLFVIADAPRASAMGEIEKSQETRQLLETIDWDCELYKNYSESNLGVFRRVSTGLDWVFKQVEQAIILEDDCLPHPSFFPFCEELLERYAQDQRIGAISGNNFQPIQPSCSESYYFSRYHHSWGWATWRRAWQYFDMDMTHWPQVRDQHLLSSILEEPQALNYWENIFQQVYDGQIQAWDYRWTLSGWLQSFLNILPSVNLVSNIGFGADASNTVQERHPLANLPTKEIHFPLRHPPFILRNGEADRYTQNTIFSPSLSRRLTRKFSRLMGH
ncbi:MAG: glycosyltransferase family 2 protein [Cyanobacteria bacterium RI_101]|nr:glycosyltransferase family 2 protein [Cyanobacteria bacterium RI_101]